MWWADAWFFDKWWDCLLFAFHSDFHPTISVTMQKTMQNHWIYHGRYEEQSPNKKWNPFLCVLIAVACLATRLTRHQSQMKHQTNKKTKKKSVQPYKNDAERKMKRQWNLKEEQKRMTNKFDQLLGEWWYRRASASILKPHIDFNGRIGW